MDQASIFWPHRAGEMRKWWTAWSRALSSSIAWHKEHNAPRVWGRTGQVPYPDGNASGLSLASDSKACSMQQQHENGAVQHAQLRQRGTTEAWTPGIDRLSLRVTIPAEDSPVMGLLLVVVLLT